MPVRFIFYLWIMLLLPPAGRAQQPPPLFREGNDPLQFTFRNLDTNRIRELVEGSAGVVESNPDSALALLKMALQESSETGFNYGTGIAWFGIGHAYSNKSMYRESMLAYRQALLYSYREPRLKSRRASIYNNMAIQYMYLGDLHQSIICLSRAALAIEEGGAILSVSSIYNNIPIILRHINAPGTKEDEKTWNYLELAEATARKEKNYGSLASALNSKGIYYGTQQNWPQSLQTLEEALKIARQYNLFNTQASALNNIATVYLQINQPDKSQSYLQTAQSLKGKIYTHHSIRTLQIQGQMYFVKGDYKRGETNLVNALEQANATSFTTALPGLYKELSELYTTTKRYPEALTYYRKYVAARDSISGKEVANNIHQLEIKYRTTQKDKEILQKEIQIALQKNSLKEKNIWIISSIAGILLLTSLLFSAYRYNRHRQRLQAEQIRNLQQEQEIISLKSMMNGEEKERTRIARELHDGIVGQLSAIRLSFSAVHNRRGLLEDTHDFEEALEQLDETTRELRKTAHNLMPEILLQAGLIEAIHIYCAKMNKGANAAISFQVSGNLPTMDNEFELGLYRITQELIQNAVKHAQASEIMVQLDYQDGLLGLTVEDNGSGFDAELLQDGTGTGLKNLPARVSVMNGVISIKSDPGEGTSVYLEFGISNNMMTEIS